jgi:hypothetical protein
MRLACNRCLNHRNENGYWPDDEPYPFNVKPAAKSSSMTMVASVCQLCGHKLDGKTGDVSGSYGKDGKACPCGCHS